MPSPDKSLKALRLPLPAGRADIVKLFGELGDDAIAEVMALRPTVAELEEAHACLEGQGNALARSGHPQTPAIAAILDIVAADGDAEEEERGHEH